MKFSQKVVLIALTLPVFHFSPALYAQTSVTGRIAVGPTANLPTCHDGDQFNANDSGTIYVCTFGSWVAQPRAPLPSDGIQYISPHGNDSNNGLSWGTAKLSIGAACAALPSGNSSCTTGTGKIFAAPGYSVSLPNGTTPAISIEISAARGGINTAPVGGTITNGPIPWIDGRAYGMRAFENSPSTIIVTTNGASAITTTGAADFIAGDGIAIPKAGNVTVQSLPSAPSITNIGAAGSTSISYKCVGVDQNWGLTAASSAGITTTAPTVFGQGAVLISSIRRNSNVVTVTTATALPFPSGTTIYHATIGDVTGGTTNFSGLQLVKITGSNSLTYTQTGANESGTVVSNTSYVLFENAFFLTSVQATAGSNELVLTTDMNHNLQTQLPNTRPTRIFLDGIKFSDAMIPGYANGLFSIDSVTPDTITVITPYTSPVTVTGTPSASLATSGIAQMTATVWAEQLVSCPTISGTTLYYAVYANYGSGYAPIGFTTWLHNDLIDYGPSFTQAGFIPPPAMDLPATPPTSTRNQIFSAQIKSISGATLTLDRPAPTNIKSVTAYHDNGVPLLNAINQSCQASGGFGRNNNAFFPVYIPPTPAAQYYLFNAPQDLATATSNGCNRIDVVDGGALWINGTLTASAPVMWQRPEDTAGVSEEVTGATTKLTVSVSGYGSPMFAGSPFNLAWWVRGLSIHPLSNGTNGFVNTGQNSRFEDFACIAGGALLSTTCFVNAGSQFTTRFHNLSFGGIPNISAPLAEAPALTGQVTYWPVPSILSENGPSNQAEIILDGQNYGVGMGFEISNLYSAVGVPFFEEFSDVQTFQAPWSPFVTISGNVQIGSLRLDRVTMDSQEMPAVSCVIGGAGGKCAGLLSLYETVSQSPGNDPIITGIPFKSVFELLQNSGVGPAQNANEVSIGPNGLQVSGNLASTPRLFSSLSVCSSVLQGVTATVIDSVTNTWGATISGGGSDVVLAFCDGLNWTVYGM